MTPSTPTVLPSTAQLCVDAWCAAIDETERYALLREHHGKRVFRFTLPDHAGIPTVIVKTWSNTRGSLWRRMKRAVIGELSGCDNEFRMSRHLEATAPILRVPAALAMFPSLSVLGLECEVVLLEDLGPCRTLTDFIKDAHSRRQASELERADGFIVDSVAALLLDAKVIDDDHSVINMVHAETTGTFHRIDFEVARHRDHCRRPERAIGGMLGRLLATYTFAYQPDVERAELFSRRLKARLGPVVTRKMWTRAVGVASSALELQRRSVGIDTRPDFSTLLGAAVKDV